MAEKLCRVTHWKTNTAESSQNRRRLAHKSALRKAVARGTIIMAPCDGVATRIIIAQCCFPFKFCHVFVYVHVFRLFRRRFHKFSGPVLFRPLTFLPENTDTSYTRETEYLLQI